MSTLWTPSQRYPDPAIVSVTPEFDQYRLPLAKLERLATGFRWCEGPVWVGEFGSLLWSDVAGNAQYCWDEQSGSTRIFRTPSNNANGNTRDRNGRLITCEHLTRRVIRTELDGQRTVLADSFNGAPLNSPNDVVCHSDGSIWFTDPVFGIAGYYEGEKADPEQTPNVYRLSPQGELSMVTDEINQPNGLAFSPDESRLYIVESRSKPKQILVYDVVDRCRLVNRQVLIDAGERGTPDGFRVDVNGNLWCGWGMGEHALDGVHVFDPAGKLIGRIDLPERCANLCFGALHRNRLFMAASTSIYSLYVNTQGMSGG